jgi:hypothetical protein
MHLGLLAAESEIRSLLKNTCWKELVVSSTPRFSFHGMECSGKSTSTKLRFIRPNLASSTYTAPYVSKCLYFN